MNILQLNFNIYPIKFIIKAIRDYSDYTQVRIKDYDNQIINLEFKCEQQHYNVIRKEFCNYLIYLIGSDI